MRVVRECSDYLRQALGFFYFQAEDGIRDLTVTGVQTCALPISTSCRPSHGAQRLGGSLLEEAIALDVAPHLHPSPVERSAIRPEHPDGQSPAARQIGRASCRERG